MTTTTYDAKVIADSVSPDGVRLTTLEVTFPRIVLAEFNTHRVFTRSSASSRAVPISKRIEMVETAPYVPASFGSNRAGMQSGDPLEGHAAAAAEELWLEARDRAVAQARLLAELGVHKEYANRLLEPFLWHTVVVTSTEWANYFALRLHPAATDPIRRTSDRMWDAIDRSQPRVINYDAWHLPYVEPDEVAPLQLAGFSPVHVSCARCARVSYLTHDGVRDAAKDLELYGRLASLGHMAPLEHAARPATSQDETLATVRFTDLAVYSSFFGAVEVTAAKSNLWFGNLRGWVQHRKELPGEAVFTGGAS